MDCEKIGGERMTRPRNLALTKKTLNFRSGDFEKMGELFPDLGPSLAIRTLVERFVNKHYAQTQADEE